MCSIKSFKENEMNKRIAAIAGEEYAKDYERGWRASLNPRTADGALDRNDSNDAWVDGYMDAACGRCKWAAVNRCECCEGW
jgi:hypothetical protein